MTGAWRRTATVLVGLGLLGAACGGGGGGGGGGTTAGGTTTGGGGVNCSSGGSSAQTVTQQGLMFHPATFSVKSCSVVTISNKDGILHTFTIANSPVDVSLAGGTKTATIALPPGTYTFYCTIHGSPNGTGMAGKITVT